MKCKNDIGEELWLRSYERQLEKSEAAAPAAAYADQAVAEWEKHCAARSGVPAEDCTMEKNGRYYAPNRCVDCVYVDSAKDVELGNIDLYYCSGEAEPRIVARYGEGATDVSVAFVPGADSPDWATWAIKQATVQGLCTTSRSVHGSPGDLTPADSLYGSAVYIGGVKASAHPHPSNVHYEVHIEWVGTAVKHVIPFPKRDHALDELAWYAEAPAEAHKHLLNLRDPITSHWECYFSSGRYIGCRTLTFQDDVWVVTAITRTGLYMCASPRYSGALAVCRRAGSVLAPMGLIDLGLVPVIPGDERALARVKALVGRLSPILE